MERALIVRLSALGDVVCTLPMAAAMKAGHPGIHVTWAVDPRFADLPRACAAVDEVVETRGRWGPSLGAFDVVLDGQGLLKSALVAARAKAPLKLGFHWQREGAGLFTSPVTPDPASVHVVDRYVDVARAAGGVADRADFALRPGVSELAPPGPYAVINAGAGWATKRWTPEGYAAVIRALGERGFTSVLIGGRAPADREAADAVLALAPAQDLLGRTSVAELVSLIGGASLHLGGDTGSTHLAAALGIPAVALHGLTNPLRSGPYGQPQNAIHAPAGLSHIPFEPVWSRIETILDDLRRSTP